MSMKKRTLSLACLLLVLGWAGSAQAQYLLTGPNDGGQLQIGTGLPLPGQIFTLGVTPGQAASFPPLLVPPASPPPGVINQTLGTGQGGAITVPPGVLSRQGTTIAMVPTFPTNPVVFQVNTAINYSWPSATAMLAPGGAPGATVLTGPGTGATITYSGGTKAFGGPGQFAVSAGSAAAGGAILGQPVTVYINYMGQSAGTATGAALVGAAVGPVGQPGASVAAPPNTTPGVAADPGFMGGAFGPAGTVLVSVQCASPCPGLTNMVTASKGYPWTTGTITLSQPAAGPAEIFYLKGTDMRVGGVGNIQLVSGALSTRALSGPNGNRGWLSLTLPEPATALGAVGALGMLGLCHGLVRRRSR